MDISVQLFDRICRVCLIQSAELKSLFTKLDGEERNLLEILSFTANVDIKIEDTLPKQVCNNCETIMCKADAFKRRCLESEVILNNAYQNATACGESPNTIENCSIKNEKLELRQKLSNYGTIIVSCVSLNNELEESFDNKNLLLQEFSACSSNNDTYKFSSDNITGQNDQLIKQEAGTDFEEDSFIDDFHNEDNFKDVPEEKVEEKIKSENKKIAVVYQCYCKSQFTSKENYKTHLDQKNCNAYTMLGEHKIFDKNNPIHCLKCDKQFTSTNSLKIHQRNHRYDDKELFQCSYCLRKFKNKTSLAAHIQRHEITDNIKHVCETCKREFKYKAYLENHILTTHSRTNGFTCDGCGQNFSDKETLETHKKTHENEKKHRCTVCSKAFVMLSTLKEHMRTHTGEKPFLCSQCGKGFSQKTNLAQHMRRHQGLKPFKCEHCEKRFVSKGELDAHNRKHSGAHPFVCDECGNGFTTSSALVKHRRIHTGERPYQCDLCPMRFAASGTLKNHRRTHTGERPFQCSYCEKAFVQRNDLISHIRCHTGERPYSCNQCGQAFRKASGLKTHVKMHIKDPIVGVNAILTSMHCTEQ